MQINSVSQKVAFSGNEKSKVLGKAAAIIIAESKMLAHMPTQKNESFLSLLKNPTLLLDDKPFYKDSLKKAAATLIRLGKKLAKQK
ncbi:MAG TPA: hypothetical protein DDW90_06945 [Cyanobacteria bacterium UBA9971]|nr:hypothetical protein [Cyanobacteria bacterium UBA9971]